MANRKAQAFCRSCNIKRGRASVQLTVQEKKKAMRLAAKEYMSVNQWVWLDKMAHQQTDFYKWGQRKAGKL